MPWPQHEIIASDKTNQVQHHDCPEHLAFGERTVGYGLMEWIRGYCMQKSTRGCGWIWSNCSYVYTLYRWLLVMNWPLCLRMTDGMCLSIISRWSQPPYCLQRAQIGGMRERKGGGVTTVCPPTPHVPLSFTLLQTVEMQPVAHSNSQGFAIA